MDDDLRAPLANHASNLQPQTKQPPVSKTKTQRLLFLEITALSGEYPADNIHRLIPSAGYAQKLIATLIAEKQIKAVNKDDKRGYRLEYKAKKNLLTDNPGRFEDYFEGTKDINRLRSEKRRRLRLHSVAEVYTLLHNTGVRIFKDTKPKVFDAAANPSQTALEKSLTITAPCFYSSREQKGEHEASNKIRRSRATGILLTPTRIYAVYNTGDCGSRWRISDEADYRVNVQDHICRKLLYNQYHGRGVDAIMIGESLDVLVKYLLPGKKSKTDLKFLTQTYRHFYFITNDDSGEAQLKLLCDDTQMSLLKTALSKKFLPPDTKYPIVHDALTEDGNPVLFCCLLDVPRLAKFKEGVIYHEKRGKVVAFGFQENALREYLKDKAEIKVIDFDAVMEWLDQQRRKGSESM